MIKTNSNFLMDMPISEHILQLAKEYQNKAELTDFEAIMIAVLDTHLQELYNLREM